MLQEVVPRCWDPEKRRTLMGRISYRMEGEAIKRDRKLTNKRRCRLCKVYMNRRKNERSNLRDHINGKSNICKALQISH